MNLHLIPYEKGMELHKVIKKEEVDYLMCPLLSSVTQDKFENIVEYSIMMSRFRL